MGGGEPTLWLGRPPRQYCTYFLAPKFKKGE
nr:MAG TPA: hypothetical protein [Caudoviricetes sp.]